MRKSFYVAIVCICVALAFTFGLYFAAPKDKKIIQTEKPVLELHALPIEPQDITVAQKYVGYVTPVHEAFVQPFISGFIEKIYVKGGELVQKGDILLVLKQDEYDAALKSAYASIIKAKADFQNKKSYFERIQKAGKSVSAAELESAEAAYLASLATLEEADAKYETAKVNYDYTIIRAPITGVLGDVSLTEGNYVSPNTQVLLNIVQFTPIRVVFSIADNEYLSELKKEALFDDEKIKLKLPNGEIFENDGTFQYTGNTLDKTTNSMAVYADFNNIGKTLTPNTYVTVLLEKTIKDAILLSKDNVILEDDGNFVYVIRKGALNKIPVEIVSAENNNFILKNVFEKDDEIVTDQILPEYLNEKVGIKKGA